MTHQFQGGVIRVMITLSQNVMGNPIDWLVDINNFLPVKDYSIPKGAKAKLRIFYYNIKKTLLQNKINFNLRKLDKINR